MKAHSGVCSRENHCENQTRSYVPPLLIAIIFFFGTSVKAQVATENMLLILSHNLNGDLSQSQSPQPVTAESSATAASVDKNSDSEPVISSCSGFIVHDLNNKKFGITAAHCIAVKEQVSPTEIKTVARSIEKTSIGEGVTISESGMRAAAVHNGRGSPIMAHIDSDFALLAVNAEVFKVTRSLPLAKVAPAKGEKLRIGGYDRMSRFVATECVFDGHRLFNLPTTAGYTNYAPTMFCSEFDGEPQHSGMSGSPVLNERNEVVGVLVGDAPTDNVNKVSSGVLAFTPLLASNFNFTTSEYTPENNSGMVDLPVYGPIQGLRASGRIEGGFLEGNVRYYTDTDPQGEWHEYQKGTHIRFVKRVSR